MEDIPDSCRPKSWVVTLNNYTEEEENHILGVSERYKELDIRYLIMGKEVGKKCGTPHLQGYIALLKQGRNKKQMKKLLGPRIRLAIAKGNDKQNQNYCSKENLWIEVGTCKTKQGARTDLLVIRDAIVEGSSVGMRELIDAGTARNYQQIKIAATLLDYYEPARNWKTHVTWIWGPSGYGKTFLAHKIAGENAYVKTSGSGKWWSGYDAHEAVILDDFRDGHMALTDLLGLLDAYSYRVECKGGMRQFRARKVVITTIKPPWEHYEHAKGEPMEQLRRRVEEVTHVNVHWKDNHD